MKKQFLSINLINTVYPQWRDLNIFPMNNETTRNAIKQFPVWSPKVLNTVKNGSCAPKAGDQIQMEFYY